MTLEVLHIRHMGWCIVFHFPFIHDIFACNLMHTDNSPTDPRRDHTVAGGWSAFHDMTQQGAQTPIVLPYEKRYAVTFQ